jgi:anti-sigma factor RsiW
MMNDPEDDLLWRYLDGELAAREHALVEKALGEDPRWRARLADLRLQDEVLRSGVLELTVEERGRRLTEGLLDAIRAEKQIHPKASPDEAAPDEDPG